MIVFFESNNISLKHINQDVQESLHVFKNKVSYVSIFFVTAMKERIINTFWIILKNNYKCEIIYTYHKINLYHKLCLRL